jgi:hypothetical protein
MPNYVVYAGVAIQFGLAIFTYGKLTNEVGNHKGWLTALSTRVDGHGERISRVEGKLGIEL